MAGILLLVGAGCQTLQEIANLRNVDFLLDRVAGVELAGVDINRVRSYSDLSPSDILRVTTALGRRELPFEFDLVVQAENPADNNVPARLVHMDWTLFLDDRETISGVLDEDILLSPGKATDIHIPIRLDLIDFFDHSARDLVELALAVSGQGGSPKRIKLQATPSIDTSMGPIRYPRPITIASREVGTR